MSFSLILCTVGRTAPLAAFFDSLLRQNRDDVQLIVVDQNTDDRLRPLFAQYAGRLNLQHVRTDTRGLSRARNVGLQHATGDLVAFPDDDCEYFDGCLDRVADMFKESPALGGITGYPTDDRSLTLDHCRNAVMPLDRVAVLNRCQEFTMFLRREAVGDVRFNDALGVGAGTPWGADEGPDFLIRVIERGAAVTFYPKLFVYHPNKVQSITPDILKRAASYARGRGCFFRLHKFPLTTVAKGVVRPAIGAGLYLALLQPMRSRYYLAVVTGMLRGLTMSSRELNDVKHAVPRVGRPACESVKTQIGLPTCATRANLVPPPLTPMPLQALSKRPLVSVLIANYNYARFLPAVLDSLQAQTYDHWEAVVCDDGSTDESAEVVRAYAARDGRIRLLEKPNGGQNTAVNACYRELGGEIVCLLDSDDTFERDKLTRVVAAFTANPKAGVANHFARIIDGDGRPQDITLNCRLDEGWLAESAFDRGGCVYVPTTSCMSFRRDVLDRLMPMPAAQRRDADGYLGMAAQFLTPFVVLDAPLAGYRVHGNNMGGLTEPTPARLQYELTLISERTQTLKDFVAEQFSEAYARRLHIEDNPQYLQAALKLHAVGDRAARSEMADARSLLKRHPSPKWRALWQAILTLPAPLRRRLLPMMHRSHKIKAALRRTFLRPAGAA